MNYGGNNPGLNDDLDVVGSVFKPVWELELISFSMANRELKAFDNATLICSQDACTDAAFPEEVLMEEAKGRVINALVNVANVVARQENTFYNDLMDLADKTNYLADFKELLLIVEQASQMIANRKVV